MKLFQKEEMQSLEAAAGEAGVPLETLMENAGAALAQETASRLRPLLGKQVVLLCGKGNNGGDGFVCARHLLEAGAICQVLLLQGQPKTGLAKAAFDQLPQAVEIIGWEKERQKAEEAMKAADCITDCVFGFSFHGRLPEEIQEAFALASSLPCLKLSADLPSGAECDTGRLSEGSFFADVTVTFTAEKPATLSYPAKAACGTVVVRQVGVPQELTAAAETEFSAPEPAFAKGLLHRPDPESNKGDLGKLLLVCGSFGMAGACVMAAQAALRCGVGLLRIVTEPSIYPIVAQAVPQAVFLPPEKLEEALKTSTACLVGCGLGAWAEQVCPKVFAHCTVPLVVDADGLNFCARHPGTLENAAAPLILTPHPGEAARLAGKSIPEIQADRIGTAKALARDTNAVAVLKGAATVTASPNGRCVINTTGNAGMAKGGSGDVLAGMIASFLAQGLPPFEAAGLGVYLHGLAGDLCAEKLGQRFMLPTDLIKALQQAFDLVE